MLRCRKVQVTVDGNEETAIAAYLVSDGIDTCTSCVSPQMVKRGFL